MSNSRFRSFALQPLPSRLSFNSRLQPIKPENAIVSDGNRRSVQSCRVCSFHAAHRTPHSLALKHVLPQPLRQ